MTTPDFDFDSGSVTIDEQPTSPSGSSQPTVPELREESVEFILDFLEAKEKFELVAFDRDADALPEKFQEAYGLEDVELLSVQSLFGLDWDDVDFVGTEPLVQNPRHPDVEDSDITEDMMDTLTEDEITTSTGDPKKYIPDPEYATQFRDANVDDSTLSALNRGINGYHSDEIVDRWGEDTRVKLAIGKKRNADGDAALQRRKVYFSTSDSSTAADKREEWREMAEGDDE